MSQPHPISTLCVVPLPTFSPAEPTESTVRFARLQTLCLALTTAVTVQQATDVVITETTTGMVSVDALRRVGSHARALSTLHDLLTDQAKAHSDADSVSPAPCSAR